VITVEVWVEYSRTPLDNLENWQQNSHTHSPRRQLPHLHLIFCYTLMWGTRKRLYGLCTVCVRDTLAVGHPGALFFQTSFVLVFIRVYKPLPMKSAPRIQRGSMGGGGSSSSKPLL